MDIKKMMLAHKIRLNPTPEQEVYLKRACGVVRFTFNWGLARWKEHYEAGQKPSALSLKAEFNAIKWEQFSWVYDVTKCAVEGAFVNLGNAFAHFFRRVKNGEKAVGYPKFKSKKYHKQSFYLANDRIAFEGNWVNIPKLGWVNMAEPLRFAGKLSRKQSGSHNREKAKLRLSRAYERIANLRNDTTHKTTTWLVHHYSFIGIEDLNTQGMLQNRKLALSISDASFFEIRRQLGYKAEWYGAIIQVVDRFFPSSKLCFGCGYVHDELTLNDRDWVCPACSMVHHRDINAARNIEREALRLGL